MEVKKSMPGYKEGKIIKVKVREIKPTTVILMVLGFSCKTSIGVRFLAILGLTRKFIPFLNVLTQ
jgi:hypothetical protein